MSENDEMPLEMLQASATILEQHALLDEAQPIVRWAATYTDNPAIKKLADAWLKKLEGA